MHYKVRLTIVHSLVGENGMKKEWNENLRITMRERTDIEGTSEKIKYNFFTSEIGEKNESKENGASLLILAGLSSSLDI